MNKFIPCRTCNSKRGPKPGYYYTKLPYGKAEAEFIVECDCHKKWYAKVKFEAKAGKNGIWTEALQYNPDEDYSGTKSLESVRRIKNFANKFDDLPGTMVYIHGPNGTQKTTLAQWVGAKLLYEGKTVQYVLMNTLIHDLQYQERDYEKVDAHQRLLEMYKNIDLLIVDESFSSDKVTMYSSGWQLPFMDRFLRERFETNKKSILFISNVEPEQLVANKFSKSIQDFVVRKTRPFQTCLDFQDNYMESVAYFDPKGLLD